MYKTIINRKNTYSKLIVKVNKFIVNNKDGNLVHPQITMLVLIKGIIHEDILLHLMRLDIIKMSSNKFHKES